MSLGPSCTPFPTLFACIRAIPRSEVTEPALRSFSLSPHPPPCAALAFARVLAKTKVLAHLDLSDNALGFDALNALTLSAQSFGCSALQFTRDPPTKPKAPLPQLPAAPAPAVVPGQAVAAVAGPSQPPQAGGAAAGAPMGWALPPAPGSAGGAAGTTSGGAGAGSCIASTGTGVASAS